MLPSSPYRTTVVRMRYQDAIRSNIKAELARRDMQGQQGAEGIGLTPAVFSSRLHGRSEWRLGELVALSSLLSVPFSKLVDGVDEAEDLHTSVTGAAA